MAQDEKAALYKQLVEQADPWLVLERMRELGFWPENQAVPEETQEAIQERTQLEDELARLRKKAAHLEDPEAALRKERVRRWQESKKRRALARADKELKNKQRAEAWKNEKAHRIAHAGEGVSGGLEDNEANDAQVAQLVEQSLPVIKSPKELAAALGTSMGELRWLTYHRECTPLVHYHRYSIPKKTGGQRGISAPKPRLRHAQNWLLNNVLRVLEVEEEAHGFVRHRSILTNASAHVGKAVVVNMDLRDFFPSVTFKRVKGMYQRLGYPSSVATLMALLCTEPPRIEAILDDTSLMIAMAERVLPQGACTSPTISNRVCRRLDRRLRGLSRSFNFAYTRYADDLTFSSPDSSRVGSFLVLVRQIIREEGFAEHKEKTRIMRKGRRQEVTGLTVNSKPGLSRRERRRLRATLHNYTKNGETENRHNHPRFIDYLRGMVAFVSSVDPDNKDKWQAALNKALVAQTSEHKE